ncbi:MAG: pilus assembly PilX N-terminal domain-containing protein [Fibrobacteria bacterium]|nr:pilus assembly PilX N-terminal domain-containing protein [Fibrobacteria bacterium]
MVQKHFQVKTRGSALLPVVVIIAVAGIISSILFNRATTDRKSYSIEKDRIQAMYLAESGIAFQLFLEKFAPEKDSTIQNWGMPDSEAFADTLQEFDLKFQFNKSLPVPTITAEHEGGYLTILSEAIVRSQTVKLKARFGRALSGPIFSSALVLTGMYPLVDGGINNIIGNILAKSRNDFSQNEFDLPDDFNIHNLIQNYRSTQQKYYKSTLNEVLSREGGGTGNGSFTGNSRPDFSEKNEIFFPLGDIYIENYSSSCIDIKGPGALYAHGEIIIKGCVRLENITLGAGRSIIFQDSVSSSGLVAYSGKSIHIHNNCNLDIQAFADNDIILTNKAQTTSSSVLVSLGTKNKMRRPQHGNSAGTDKDIQGDWLSFGIMLFDESRARGLIVAAGANGKLMLETSYNMLEGIGIIKSNSWVAGTINGLLITDILRCNDDSKSNCLGKGVINRRRLPSQMALPLDFVVKGNRTYKLIRWEPVL